MESPVKAGFCRRPSLDGRTISFCTHCYAVVAEAKDSKQLEDGEREHKCDPRTLEHVQRVVEQARKDCA